MAKDKSTFLHAGYDVQTPDPGEHETMNCVTCDSKMDVTRNVDGPTGSSEARAKRSHLHDCFECPHAGTMWHNQVIALLQLIKTTPSAVFASMLTAEKDAIIKSQVATKEVSPFSF